MHLVVKKGKYAELYENVPGKRGKKRFVRYLGVLGRIDWKATLISDEPVDWFKIEQDALAHMEKQEREQQAKLSELHDKFGLTLGPETAKPIEKSSSKVGHDALVEPVVGSLGPAGEAAPSAEVNDVTLAYAAGNDLAEASQDIAGDIATKV